MPKDAYGWHCELHGFSAYRLVEEMRAQAECVELLGDNTLCLKRMTFLPRMS